MMEPVVGLTSAQARARLADVGPNDLAPPRRLAALREIVHLFANPLVLVLLGACAVSASLGQVFSAEIIALMVVISVVLNFFQAFTSERAAERLRARVAQTATVLRDGDAQEITVSGVVPDDVVRCTAGDLVPADARLTTARDLFVSEAALTGESLPVEKHAGEMILRGTSVVSGLGLARVERTGSATEIGAVAAQLARRAPETDFERGMRQFGLLIVRLVLVLTVGVFFVNALFQRDLVESLLFAVALAVGLTPELLPMIISVTLARGAVRMAARKVIVKRLASIENFGSMDVLCSDKTGTLTRGEMTLARHVNARGEEDEEVIRLACENAGYQTGLRSPMDEALLRHDHPDVARAVRIDEVPFDFERRRVSVVVERDGGRELITKGAPESVLGACASVRVDGETRLLDDEVRKNADALFASLSADGYRVLAIAARPVPVRDLYGRDDEHELTFVGFAAFIDPPLEDAGVAMAALREDGVEVKILTGDSELVTQKICADLGIVTGDVVTGSAVDRMSDPALAAVAERTTVFARVTPVQKNRIVHALRSRGHVVGCLGDGINDAPALRSADVGISVQHAVDVARDAADIILLEKSLAVLHDGVVEGRRSFGNIMKYVLMGTSSNFGNMLSMAAASLFLPFLPMLPVQILLNNLLYDAAQLGIPSDRVDRTYMLKPRRWNVAWIRRYMLVLGPISSLYDFLTFAVMLRVFHAGEALFRTGWFMESLATQTFVIFVIRTSAPAWTSRPSLALTAGAVLAVGAGMILPFTPLAGPLGFTPPPALFLVVLAGMVLTYLLLVEAVKRRLSHHDGG